MSEQQQVHLTSAVPSGLDTPALPEDPQFFDGGWCWMAHPSYNDGNPIPVKMDVLDGVRYYFPLDPIDALDFEWDRRDAEWEIISPALAAPLIAAAPDLLQAGEQLLAIIKDGNLAEMSDYLESIFQEAVAKATGAA